MLRFLRLGISSVDMLPFYAYYGKTLRVELRDSLTDENMNETPVFVQSSEF